jgi:protein SCO1/2
MSLAIDRLGKIGDEVQPLFVTLDPDRDTPQHLANYVTLFHPRLIALAGDAIAGVVRSVLWIRTVAQDRGDVCAGS